MAVDPAAFFGTPLVGRRGGGGARPRRALRVRGRATMPKTAAGLRSTIETYLTEANIPFRDRGDRMSVRRGSTAVFIKPAQWSGQHTVVELLCPVLVDVEVDRGLLDKLNELNKQLYFGKAYWHDRGVWLAHNLLGDHVDRDELLAAVGMIVTVADKLDDELKAAFGGTRWIDS
jgi:hypothetical protein